MDDVSEGEFDWKVQNVEFEKGIWSRNNGIGRLLLGISLRGRSEVGSVDTGVFISFQTEQTELNIHWSHTF